jgi:hypothetical protein
MVSKRALSYIFSLQQEKMITQRWQPIHQIHWKFDMQELNINFIDCAKPSQRTHIKALNMHFADYAKCFNYVELVAHYLIGA